jgi:DNA-binding CsgD family transcriptional regulator
MSEEFKNTLNLFQKTESWLPGVKIIQLKEPFQTIYVSPNSSELFGQSPMSIIHLPEGEFKKAVFDPEEKGTCLLGIAAATTEEIGTRYYIREVQARIDLVISKTMAMDELSSSAKINLLQIIPFQVLPDLQNKVKRLIGEFNFKIQHNEKVDNLSERKQLVLRYMTQFLACKEISSMLNVSEHTVNTHKQQIRERLSINRDLDLIFFGLAFDFIPSDPNRNQPLIDL